MCPKCGTKEFYPHPKTSTMVQCANSNCAESVDKSCYEAFKIKCSNCGLRKRIKGADVCQTCVWSPRSAAKDPEKIGGFTI